MIRADEENKLAIVGMEARYGSTESLDAFDQKIFSGTNGMAALNPQLPDSLSASDGYHHCFFANQVKQVAEGAVRDARINPDDRLGIIILAPLPHSSADPNPMTKADMADLISTSLQLPNLTIATLPPGSPIAAALQTSQTFISSGKVEAVLIIAAERNPRNASALPTPNGGKPGGFHPFSFDRDYVQPVLGEGIGAVVVKAYKTALRAEDRVYAVIETINISQPQNKVLATNIPSGSPNPDLLERLSSQSLQAAGVKPNQIGYLEVAGVGLPEWDNAEIEALTRVYRACGPDPVLTCALGSVKSTFGDAGSAAGMASLIKTALCLHKKYLPATPGWSAPKHPEKWQSTLFYVPSDSRTWFASPYNPARRAAINEITPAGTFTTMVLSEGSPVKKTLGKSFKHQDVYLLPIAGEDHNTIQRQLDDLEHHIQSSSNLWETSERAFESYQDQEGAKYALGILALNSGEALREIEHARKGISKAFDHGGEWQTPLGSYFTARPAGGQGKIAFVYPGAFNSYPGVGRELLYLFPEAYDLFSQITSNAAGIFREHLLYPRSLEAITPHRLAVLENQLVGDSVAMLSSGSGLAVLYTLILQNIFKVKPDCAFGYSLGESSMLFAFQVWTDGDRMEASLESSPLFKTRISGDKQAVLDYWGMHPDPAFKNGDLWGNFVVMESPEVVQEQVDQEDRVYLTHVNTPKQVVIAGDPEQCKRVISRLQRPSIRAPFDQVLHCEVMASEYGELVDLHTRPVHNRPEIPLLSAADYQPLRPESRSIAKSIAKTLCTPLDFPKLIDRAYDNGTKVFIELGAGSNCAKWIEDTLKGKEHASLSLNRRNLKDSVAIPRALAKLVSQRVPVDLSYIYQ